MSEAMSVPNSREEMLLRKPRRKRCRTWNHNNTIAVEESDTNIEHLVKGRWNAGIDCVKTCDNLMNKHLSLPLLELTEAQIAIWKCMWLKYGNMKLVKML